MLKRTLKTTLGLLLGVLAIGWISRWLVLKFRRILLLPTADTTPPILPAQVAPGMRRIVVSDLHLGAGDRLDDFDADAELVDFIRSFVMRTQPTELILAGDTFEFLQVRLPDLSDFTWSGEAAARRLATILAAHPLVVAALGEFVTQPENQLTLLIGNHDFELHYAQAKAQLRTAIGLGPDDPRLRFGLTYSGGGVYIDHGMQFDPWNRFVNAEGISQPFEVVRGTRMVKEVINSLEDDPLDAAPWIDNVKPSSAFFWYLLALPQLRQPHVRRFLLKGLLKMARSNALPPSYGLQPLPPRSPQESEAQARRRGQRLIAFAQLLLQRLKRTQPDSALAQIQQEAKRQLRREIREFKDAMVQAIAQIAATPEHRDTTLFVCGHSHNTELVALNQRQTYVNTGTWTAIVLDLASRRREEQRFPFLEVSYEPGSAEPTGRLLVWQSRTTAPAPWLDALASGPNTRFDERSPYPLQ